MAKTRKTIQLKNLAKYDVLIEDTQANSAYFQITNLPTVLTGGRNSFLLAGSSALVQGSAIQIEILDASGNTIYQNPVRKYIEGQSRLVTVEVNEATASGFATIIVLGRASVYPNGTPVPPDWQSAYNVRWVGKVLVEPKRRNISPLILENVPQVFVEEQRLFNVDTASFTTNTASFTASLSPIKYSSFEIGYLIKAVPPTTFSADYLDGHITGSLLIDGVSASLYIPITQILNDTTAFSTGHLIQTSEGKTINSLYLQSGSYQTQLSGNISDITSSAVLVYNSLVASNNNIPISYGKLRVVNLNTVSGEIYKLKVYNKVATNFSDYKLIADVPVITSELLISSSTRGDIPIGDFTQSPLASASWYAGPLALNNNILYPISGSSAYYIPTGSDPINLQVTDDVLLRSVRADVPIHNNSAYEGILSSSGYFIGTIRPFTVFPTSEYTIQLDAVYKQASGSAVLATNEPVVDIYIVGVNGSTIIDDNPLGQKVGTLRVNTNSQIQLYETQQFNFTPKLANLGQVGLRFVVRDGFWYFSKISLKPASDDKFAPDETTFIIPNIEYYNELLQYKIEFFDINNNSTDISVLSLPTFFTGSNIDLGVLE